MNGSALFCFCDIENIKKYCFSFSWSLAHWKLSWGQRGSSKNHTLSHGTIEQVVIIQKPSFRIYFVFFFNLTNRFHVAVRLFSSRSQMTSKCSKNKNLTHEAIAECVTDMLLVTSPPHTKCFFFTKRATLVSCQVLLAKMSYFILGLEVKGKRLLLKCNGYLPGLHYLTHFLVVLRH